jgi:hypothetical protein
MRTKTLLLTAALSVAGIATSMAQTPVFSVNAVGYVNTPLVPGFNLISNPLDNKTGNQIANLFNGNTLSRAAGAAVPAGTVIYYYIPGTGFDFVSWDDIDLKFTPDTKAATVIAPGSGVFVKNPLPAGQNMTNTFVGEVPQSGATPLSHPIPAGFSIQASEVPQEGAADTLGLVGADGDRIYFFTPATQGYTAPFQYDAGFGEWSPALSTRPLKVGEAMFYQNRGAARTWTRTFTVNN